MPESNDTGNTALIWCITIIFVMCLGDPDLLDALIKFFMK